MGVPGMKYYGQFHPPLDQLLHERYFGDCRGGVFLECGATDGVMESTCKFVEKFEALGYAFEVTMHNNSVFVRRDPPAAAAALSTT